MKIKYFIISLVLVVVLAGTGVGLYCAWPAITGTITDSKYYTSEDVQNAYDKGYDEALSNKDELTSQIEYYKGLTDQYYLSILDYQKQVASYEKQNSANEETIKTLQDSKTNLESQVENLTETNSSNEKIIAENNKTISSLQSQVNSLQSSVEDKSEEIEQLNSTIDSLRNINSQLETTNNNNLTTISTLNGQIVNLNKQVNELMGQVSNNSNVVSSLNVKIQELEKSIAYYEQYIAQLESDTQVVATFEFDGSVYNVQILEKGSYASVTAPTSTDYVVFNYWTVNGEQVDLSTYAITTNTKFVANVTHKYDVIFMVDNEEYDKQIIAENGYASNVAIEDTDYKLFDGWSVNGEKIELLDYEITQNTIFTALFKYKFDVQFLVDDGVFDKQIVLENSFATLPSIPEKDGYIFKGWTLDGFNVVDVESTLIVGETNFVAYFEQAFGLFSNDTNDLLINWDDLLSNDCLQVNGTLLTRGTKYKDLSGVLKIPDGITSVQLAIPGLIKIILPSTLNKLENSAFNGCSSLIELEIPNGVTELPMQCFYNCVNLKSVKLPASLEILPDSLYMAFSGCDNLETIIIDEDNKVYDSRDNCNAIIETSTNTLLYGCKGTVIPRSVVSIADRAFYFSSSVETIFIPNNIETIGIYAFAESGLSSIKFEENSKISRIENYVFKSCANLISIELPDSIISIGDSSFRSCSKLESIKLPANLIEIGTKSLGVSSTISCGETFAYCSSLTSIYIPSSVSVICYGTRSANGDYPIFYKCSSSLKLYLGATEIPDDWGSKVFNYSDSSSLKNIYYGYTYEQYLEEIGA